MMLYVPELVFIIVSSGGTEHVSYTLEDDILDNDEASEDVSIVCLMYFMSLLNVFDRFC